MMNKDITFEEYFPIKKHIIHKNKALGQHFLTDRNILNKIANVVHIQNRNVVEIGGGIGNLTIYVNNKNPKSYIIVEKDNYYGEYLQKLFPSINVIMGDCLQWMNNTDILMGNLPYNVATNFILQTIENMQFNEAVFLIQREVAYRMIALPRSKIYGPLSVITQLFTHAKIMFHVGSSSFCPAPKVVSSTIYLKRNEKICTKPFMDFVFKAFKNRRKKYYNNLCPDQITPQMYYDIFHQK